MGSNLENCQATILHKHVSEGVIEPQQGEFLRMCSGSERWLSRYRCLLREPVSEPGEPVSEPGELSCSVFGTHVKVGGENPLYKVDF